MKHLLTFFTVALFFFSGAKFGYGSPLVFKYSKEIKTETPVEFTNFDAGKYKQIRIGIKRKAEYKEEPENTAFELSLYAVDIEEELFLMSANAQISYTTLIDSPPPRLRLKIRGNGTFILYVWANTE